MKSFVPLLAAAIVATGLSMEAQAQFRSAVRPPVVRTPSVRPTVTPRAASTAPKTSISTPRRPATASAVTSPRPASVSQRSAVVSRKNGNSLSSNRAQHLYGIFETNKTTGNTRIHKYGVSGGTSRSGSQLPASMQRTTKSPTRDYSNRALRQVKQLNREAAKSNQPLKYTTRTLQRVPSSSNSSFSARQSVLASEKQAVTRHAVKRTSVPRGNKQPTPAPTSPLGTRK